jgi:hypothetical protein
VDRQGQWGKAEVDGGGATRDTEAADRDQGHRVRDTEIAARDRR